MRLFATWPTFILPVLLGLFAMLVVGHGLLRSAWSGPATLAYGVSVQGARAEAPLAEAEQFGVGARQSDDSSPANEGDLSRSLCDIPDEDADETPLVLSAAHPRTVGWSRVVLRADPAPSVPPLLVELPPPRG